MSIFKISNFHNFFLTYYSKYLSSKLCIDMRNKVNCIMYYGTEGLRFIFTNLPTVDMKRVINIAEPMQFYAKQGS